MRRQYQADFIIRRALQLFAVIFIIGTLLRIFLISSFVMSGVSMMPTIWPGDFLLGTKWRAANVARGEIIALRCPNDKDQICLKRVVGLPGDRIEIRAGALTVNGEPPDQDRSVWPEATLDSEPKAEPVAIVVPPQHIYVLNDKREALEDSRSWGPIKTDLIEARIQRTWLSLEWFDGSVVRTWPKLRPERMFRSMN